VLVDSQRHHPGQPVRVGHPPGGFDLDRVPAGAPVHPQVTGQCRDGRVVVSQGGGGPDRRPGRELGPRPDHVVALSERGDWAAGVGPTPDPLAPADHGRRSSGGHRRGHPAGVAPFDRRKPRWTTSTAGAICAIPSAAGCPRHRPRRREPRDRQHRRAARDQPGGTGRRLQGIPSCGLLRLPPLPSRARRCTREATRAWRRRSSSTSRRSTGSCSSHPWWSPIAGEWCVEELRVAP
jgi:hypothetical protein